MKIYINSRNEIKDVNFSTDASLREYETNVFDGWSKARILCYAVQIDNDGNVGGYYPYIDSRIIDQLDNLGTQTELNATDIVETQIGLADTFEAMEQNSESITVCEEALAEIYELLLSGEV